MNARRMAALLLVVAVAVIVVAGCSSGSTATTPAPAPRSQATEAPVAVTVPSGPETLPTWERRGSTATLVIPADLLFATDSADLSPAASVVLQALVDEVGGRPLAHVMVEGHADADGDAGHNQVLSERRATAVAAWLATNDVDPSTIATTGWGESRPAVADGGGADEAPKAQNRRVVVTLTFATPINRHVRSNR